MQIITISDQKCSSAKTIATVNLGTALAEKKKKVLILDKDSVVFSIEDLIRGVGLQTTARSKSSEAKKLLSAKLQRFRARGIIESYPPYLPSGLKEKITIVFPPRKS